MKEYRWCAIDAEGDVGEKGLLGVAFYSDQLQAYLTEPDEIREQLQYHANEGYTFLAHNASYDLSVIFWQLHIPMKCIFYNGRFNRGEWRYDKRRNLAELWDTLALSGGINLSDLGKALDCPKYPTPQKLKGIDPDKWEWKCDKHQIWECETCYAVRDAEIVYRFMVQFEQLLKGWGIEPKRRISALSMDTWKILDRPDNISISDRRILSLSRDAYAGGRVETFKLGHINHVYTADVCSMYPSVMLTTPYPDPKHMAYVTDREPSRINWSFEGVADIDITIPNMYIPPLPYMANNERLFPIGRIRGQWTFLEIRYAIQCGCIVNHVFRAAFSTSSIHPFTTFIGTMWELRQEYERKNDPRSIFAKLLMNNLYGRLGMRDGIQKRVITPAPDGSSSVDWHGYEWEIISGYPYLRRESTDYYGNQWSNVLWAAQTTAGARVKLHKFMAMQGDNIVYCDTDSVFSTAPILGLGEGLGSLRDPQELEWMLIVQPKLYAYKMIAGNVVGKAKGVPRDMALQFIQQGSATFRAPVRPWEARRRGIPAGTWVTVTKDRQLVPHRRAPVAPQALLDPLGYSDTRPPVCGPLRRSML